MTPQKQLERDVLDGKDRDELHAIAGAMGVRVPTRMKKADLVEAIMEAASNGDSSQTATRKVRSTKSSASIEELAADEEALASADADQGEDPPLPSRGRTRTASVAKGDVDGTKVETNGPDDATTRTKDRPAKEDNRSEGKGDGERQFGAEGNRRRRRRGRGRDRERVEEPQGEPVEIEGLLDLRDEGYGFLRATGYLAGPQDAYVSASQVRKFALRRGDHVKGFTRPPASNEKYPALLRVDEINGMTPDEARERPKFESLTPLFPDSRLRLELEDDPLELTGRIVDLLSPIGKGQRGLVVSPPKAGKTTILKQLVYSLERNNPEVHLMVLLVDERPEEVTDMRRHVVRGEVVASTFDRPSEEHTQVAELAIERAKRLVEMGTDVVVVLDGITRLARAYNLAAPASGRILSGGVDSTALYPPKRFFGAARNIEEGGSLTIVATALIETGSRMDEVIFEEFKGTGNMELRLDRRLAERRIYPAIDVDASSTRHEELLFERNQLNQVWKLRRVLNALAADGSTAPGLELLIDKLKTTKSNDEFLAEIAKAPTPGG